jgi:RecA-family ATPase
MDGPRTGIDAVVPYAPPRPNGEAKIDDAVCNVRALRLTIHELLAPIEPEEYLLPGLIPTESYTLIAGALSTFKSTFLIYLCLWRATGTDLLNLDPVGAGCDIGPVLLTFYEDSDRRMTSRIRRIVQAAHEHIRQQRGPKAATTFLNNVSRNFSRVPLTGQAGATIVYRADSGIVLPNNGMIESLIAAARELAKSDLMIAIDPLRLAITGSQNDDDVGAAVVHTLNLIANRLPRSGLIVVSHTTKAEAKEPTEGYAARHTLQLVLRYTASTPAPIFC